MFKTKIIKSIWFILFINLNSSCAYFNTFYNAEKYFQEADTIRKEKEGKDITLSALDKYGKAIQKSQLVLDNYPNSKLKLKAMLLMAKSRFFRKDYENALNQLKLVEVDATKDLLIESKYWQAMCKWKMGRPQSAIDELLLIIENSNKNSFIADSYLSLSDIYLEQNDQVNMLFYLELAANTMDERSQRGTIYNKLARQAYKNNNKEIALEAYKRVTKNSLSKEKVETAHLEIIKIMRENGDNKSAAKKIKVMLSNDKFARIAPKLELELARYYLAKSKIEEAINRLQAVVSSYPRTEYSAEAYYYLGGIYLRIKIDLSKASEFYSNVKKEYSRSTFISESSKKIKSIDDFINTKEKLVNFRKVNSDSSMSDSTELISENINEEEFLYKLGLIEIDIFKNFQNGIDYFKEIARSKKKSDYRPKALFALAYFLSINGDTTNSDIFLDQLKIEFPDSDYSIYFEPEVLNDFINNDDSRSYEVAQKMWGIDQLASINSMKKIIKNSDDSQILAKATFSLAYGYENSILEIDSAKKYYSMLLESHPTSLQSVEGAKRLKFLDYISKKDTVKLEEKTLE